MDPKLNQHFLQASVDLLFTKTSIEYSKDTAVLNTPEKGSSNLTPSFSVSSLCFSVIARLFSVFRYRGTARDISDIALTHLQKESAFYTHFASFYNKNDFSNEMIRIHFLILALLKINESEIRSDVSKAKIEELEERAVVMIERQRIALSKGGFDKLFLDKEVISKEIIKIIDEFKSKDLLDYFLCFSNKVYCDHLNTKLTEKKSYYSEGDRHIHEENVSASLEKKEDKQEIRSGDFEHLLNNKKFASEEKKAEKTKTQKQVKRDRKDFLVNFLKENKRSPFTQKKPLKPETKGLRKSIQKLKNTKIGKDKKRVIKTSFTEQYIVKKNRRTSMQVINLKECSGEDLDFLYEAQNEFGNTKLNRMCSFANSDQTKLPSHDELTFEEFRGFNEKEEFIAFNEINKDSLDMEKVFNNVQIRN